jgi:hypothetical protein
MTTIDLSMSKFVTAAKDDSAWRSASPGSNIRTSASGTSAQGTNLAAAHPCTGSQTASGGGTNFPDAQVRIASQRSHGIGDSTSPGTPLPFISGDAGGPNLPSPNPCSEAILDTVTATQPPCVQTMYEISKVVSAQGPILPSSQARIGSQSENGDGNSTSPRHVLSALTELAVGTKLAAIHQASESQSECGGGNSTSPGPCPSAQGVTARGTRLVSTHTSHVCQGPIGGDNPFPRAQNGVVQPKVRWREDSTSSPGSIVHVLTKPRTAQGTNLPLPNAHAKARARMAAATNLPGPGDLSAASPARGPNLPPSNAKTAANGCLVAATNLSMPNTMVSAKKGLAWRPTFPHPTTMCQPKHCWCGDSTCHCPTPVWKPKTLWQWQPTSPRPRITCQPDRSWRGDQLPAPKAITSASTSLVRGPTSLSAVAWGTRFTAIQHSGACQTPAGGGNQLPCAHTGVDGQSTPGTGIYREMRRRR